MTFRRTVRMSLTVICAAVFCLAPTLAQAQTVPFVTLRDADAAALASIMRAQSQRVDAGMREAVESGQQAGRAFMSRAAFADTVDPLAYVKTGTKHFAVPSDARYDAACSRDLSRNYLSAQAVFAIGKPDNDVVAKLQGRKPGELGNKEMWDVMMAQGRGSAGQAFTAASGYYRSHGFKLIGAVEHSADFGWGGAGNDRLIASVYPDNYGAGLGSAACAQLGNTAVVILSLRRDGPTLGATAERSSAATDARSAEDAYTAALRRAGLDAERYEAIHTAAMDAYMNSRSPETLDVLERIAVDERNVDDRRSVLVRRQNVAWYRRHAAELEPLFKQYAPR